MAIWLLILGLICVTLGFGFLLYAAICNKTWAFRVAICLLLMAMLLNAFVR